MVRFTFKIGDYLFVVDGNRFYVLEGGEGRSRFFLSRLADNRSYPYVPSVFRREVLKRVIKIYGNQADVRFLAEMFLRHSWMDYGVLDSLLSSLVKGKSDSFSNMGYGVTVFVNSDFNSEYDVRKCQEIKDLRFDPDTFEAIASSGVSYKCFACKDAQGNIRLHRCRFGRVGIEFLNLRDYNVLDTSLMEVLAIGRKNTRYLIFRFPKYFYVGKNINVGFDDVVEAFKSGSYKRWGLKEYVFTLPRFREVVFNIVGGLYGDSKEVRIVTGLKVEKVLAEPFVTTSQFYFKNNRFLLLNKLLDSIVDGIKDRWFSSDGWAYLINYDVREVARVIRDIYAPCFSEGRGIGSRLLARVAWISGVEPDVCFICGYGDYGLCKFGKVFIIYPYSV